MCGEDRSTGIPRRSPAAGEGRALASRAAWRSPRPADSPAVVRCVITCLRLPLDSRCLLLAPHDSRQKSAKRVPGTSPGASPLRSGTCRVSRFSVTNPPSDSPLQRSCELREIAALDGGKPKSSSVNEPDLEVLGRVIVNEAHVRYREGLGVERVPPQPKAIARDPDASSPGVDQSTQAKGDHQGAQRHEFPRSPPYSPPKTQEPQNNATTCDQRVRERQHDHREPRVRIGMHWHSPRSQSRVPGTHLADLSMCNEALGVSARVFLSSPVQGKPSGDRFSLERGGTRSRVARYVASNLTAARVVRAP